MIFDEISIPYKEGDVIVIPPNIPHTNRSQTGFTNIFINLSNSTLNFRTPIRIQSDINHFILNAFNAAYYHYNEGTNRDNLLVAYGHLLVGYINTLRQDPVRSNIVEEIRINTCVTSVWIQLPNGLVPRSTTAATSPRSPVPADSMNRCIFPGCSKRSSVSRRAITGSAGRQPSDGWTRKMCRSQILTAHDLRIAEQERRDAFRIILNDRL